MIAKDTFEVFKVIINLEKEIDTRIAQNYIEILSDYSSKYLSKDSIPEAEEKIDEISNSIEKYSSKYVLALYLAMLGIIFKNETKQKNKEVYFYIAGKYIKMVERIAKEKKVGKYDTNIWLFMKKFEIEDAIKESKILDYIYLDNLKQKEMLMNYSYFEIEVCNPRIPTDKVKCSKFRYYDLNNPLVYRKEDLSDCRYTFIKNWAESSTEVMCIEKNNSLYIYPKEVYQTYMGHIRNK